MIVAVILINISLAGAISKVELKEVDDVVKINLNTVSSYKTFFEDDKIRILFKDTDFNLSQNEATLMPGGPVSKIALSKDGNNTYLDIFLSYSSVNYKVYVVGGSTFIEVKQKDLPEPVGPKTYSGSQKVRNYIVLSAAEQSDSQSSKFEESKQNDQISQVEVKKVEVNKQKEETKKSVSKPVQKVVKTTTPTKVNVVSSKKTITLDLVDSTLVDAVRLITEDLGWNVIFSPDVLKYQEKLTMKLVNVEAEKALKMILLANGFDYKIVNGIAYVSTPDKLEKFQQDVKISGPTKSQVINLENASAKEIEPVVKSNFPEASVQVVEKTNSLLVKAPVQTIVEIKNLISQLDVPPPPPPPVTPPVTEVVRLNYAIADEVVGMMGNLVPKEAIAIDKRMNSLIVTATPDIIEIVKSFVKAVDVPMPQVALRLHFLSVTESGSRSLGVDWGQYSNNIQLQEQMNSPDLGVKWFSRSALQFNATLNYLINNQKAKVLSAPYIMTQNRQQAEIQVGQQIPILYTDYRTGQIQAQYINVGIILRVTPDISPDGYVTLQLNPEISELGAQIAGTQYYIINTNRIQNLVRIKQGDTVILGGLFRNTDSDAYKKVPLLGDIPIIGEIFRTRSKTKDRTELVVAITPVVITDLPKLEETGVYENMKKKNLKVKDTTNF